MEAIIFVGLQASGKSTFYKNHYFNTHLRISNDLLKTRYREKKLLEICLETSMPFVVDNTNPTRAVRATYIDLLKGSKFKIRCVYFRIDLERSLAWNRSRSGAALIPDVGIFDTHKRIELPTMAEGFDQMQYVDIIDNQFIVKAWNEI
ncbi:AAA family ATPase [Massilia violaceinigra]|uniref:AAA family ATPase n=1 Tax=Massilia violaceinigra TaxID=2045208 RepID=A0ABY4AC81_9BURK|nr:AAA family ATPase [Massilia violaceinigra]UOD32403.1 AAA family ATPase [Massilia violaceinigra]